MIRDFACRCGEQDLCPYGEGCPFDTVEPACVVSGVAANVVSMTPTEKAPRCEPAPDAWRFPGPHTQMIPDEDGWAGGTHTTCLRCGQRVKFRVRETDVPPFARIMPHRTDGTPCR